MHMQVGGSMIRRCAWVGGWAWAVDGWTGRGFQLRQCQPSRARRELGIAACCEIALVSWTFFLTVELK